MILTKPQTGFMEGAQMTKVRFTFLLEIDPGVGGGPRHRPDQCLPGLHYKEIILEK